MTLKDLRGKSILVNDTEELNNVLMYMELSGVLWVSGTKPTQDNEDITLPTLLNLDSDDELSYTDCWYFNEVEDWIIDYRDLKLNWYKVLQCTNSLYSKKIHLYHIPTNQNLPLNGLWKGFLTYGKADSHLPLQEDFKLTSSSEMTLYKDLDHNTLCVKFLINGNIINITKDGFKDDSYLHKEMIDEVTFKKVN